MMAIKLTMKREKFVQGIFAGLSQKDAYIEAGYKTDTMTEKTINEAASRLSKEPKIQKRLKELKSKLQERNMVTIERIIDEYAKIGFADIKDYLEFKTVKTEIGYDEETNEPIIDYKTVVDLKESTVVDGSLINEVNIARDGTLKIKLHDKHKALENMGRYLGMFKDKVEHSGNVGINKKLEDFFE